MNELARLNWQQSNREKEDKLWKSGLTSIPNVSKEEESIPQMNIGDLLNKLDRLEVENDKLEVEI